MPLIFSSPYIGSLRDSDVKSSLILEMGCEVEADKQKTLRLEQFARGRESVIRTPNPRTSHIVGRGLFAERYRMPSAQFGRLAGSDHALTCLHLLIPSVLFEARGNLDLHTVAVR